jgi:hypothetical protein
MQEFTALIVKALGRGYADLIASVGRERAPDEWAKLAKATGGDMYLSLEDFDCDQIMALDVLPPSRYELRLPTDACAPELRELYWAINGVATLWRVHEAFGYEPPKIEFMFDRFDVREALLGGMGMVIEGVDVELERKVAIKLWSQDGPDARAALLAEAKTLARLTHPNVVTIYGTGHWRERVYFVMEWIEGTDGHGWLKQPRTWQEVLEVFLAAGEGLAAAHDAGIQHRDFKPGNLLIGHDGRVVVADFGLADSLAAVTPYDAFGLAAAFDHGAPGDAPDDADAPDDELDKEVELFRQLMDNALKGVKVPGTRCYVAPERLRLDPGDARSDQFSFCVALWEALHGVCPYAGRSRSDVLKSIERGAIQSGPLTHQVPHWLSRVVRKGLADDSDQRYASMRELLQALRDEPAEVEDSDAAEAEASAVGENDGRLLNTPTAGGPTWRMRVGAMLGAMVVGGLLVGGGMVVGLEYGRESERAGRQPIAELVPSHEGELRADMPCVLSEFDTTPVDPVVLEVCQMILRDDIEGASSRWQHEHDERVKSGRPVGVDSLIVARTFSARAEALIQNNDHATAREAARRARRWASLALTKLDGDRPRQSEAAAISKMYADQ